MARFSKMSIAAMPLPVVVAPPEPAPPDPVMVEVARNAVTPPPPQDPAQSDRLTALLKLKVRSNDPALGQAAIGAAARLRCRMPGTISEHDRKATGKIARFLLWAAFGGVIDERRAFTRGNVDEYLIQTRTNSENSMRETRHVLYAAGRVLHPREFPPRNNLTAPRRKRQPAASAADIRELQALIPGLPPALGMRAQALLDLTHGAGARAGDCKRLRGTAISSMSCEGRAVAVVTLPNNQGGVRQVPVLDPQISARLIILAASVGDRLVLSPTTETIDRNIVNRISQALRERDLPTMDPIALRNRWILDLSECVPAALLVQLADVGDLRVLADQRKLLPHFTIRHAITILSEVSR